MSKTEVIILGTLHGLHKDHKKYSYEDIFDLVTFYNPDVLGVEIRKEDMNEPLEYLSEFYPYEMIELKSRFNHSMEVYGFDFLGHDLIDKLIPNNYFENHKKTLLEKQFEHDNDFVQAKTLFDIINQTRLDLIMDYNAQSINNGMYDLISNIYYKQMKFLFENTVYRELSDFYASRDHRIAQNIIEIIQANPNKRMVFVMGIDHRAYTIDAIKTFFKESIYLLPVINLKD